MVRIVRIVEQDIAPKLDAEYVEQFLGAVEGNVGIIYACTKGDWRRNYSWKKDGWQYYRIVLPYEKVAAMNVAEVREWMLQLAKERLGLTPEKPAAVRGSDPAPLKAPASLGRGTKFHRKSAGS